MTTHAFAALFAFVILVDPWLPAAAVPDLVVLPGSGPLLSIPDNIQAPAAASVLVPVHFAADGNSISSAAFSIDFDEIWLAFDPTDSDGDGVPDAVAFNLPAAFNGSVSFDAGDTDGELDFLIVDVFPPLASLPDRDIVSITFGTGSPTVLTTAYVAFSTNPPVSFGSTTGQSIPGTADDGSVRIQGLYDLNDDGRVDVLDIQLIASCWHIAIGGSCPSSYDVNRSGAIDIVDVQQLAGAWGP